MVTSSWQKAAVDSQRSGQIVLNVSQETVYSNSGKWKTLIVIHTALSLCSFSVTLIAHYAESRIFLSILFSEPGNQKA